MKKREIFNSNFPLHSNPIPSSAPHRIFVNHEHIEKKRVLLRGEPLKKVMRVLRLEPKEILCVFDGFGSEYLTQIVSLTPNEGELIILEKANPQRESPLEIHLGQAVPKSHKMDLIIQKSVELGIFEVHPLFSSRTIPRYDSKQEMRKIERWQKISQEASQQSGRTHIPRVNPPVAFIDVLSLPSKTSLKIILQKEPSQDSLKNFLQTNQKKRCVFFLVGPEGGFSLEEVALAQQYDFQRLSLGKRILRTETVALTFLSILQYELGDIV